MDHHVATQEQGAIVLHFHHKVLNFIPTMHASSRKQLVYIAPGNRAEQSLDFYASLTQAEETQEIVHGSDMTSDGPDFSLYVRTTAQRIRLLQPYFGHLSCIPFVCMTRKVQGMLSV